jgi:serine/threonine protein kinase
MRFATLPLLFLGWNSVVQATPASLENRGKGDIQCPPYGTIHLDQRLGQGGFGSIFKGTILKTGQTVAVKRMHDEDGHELNGYRVVMQKVPQNRRIMTVYTICKYEDYDYVVTALVSGEDLYQAMQRRLSESEVSGYAKELVKGAAYLHEHNVAHRDIKSMNAIAGRTSRGLLVTLIDYDYTTDKRTSGFKCGTKRYMSPERFSPQIEKYDTMKDDVWALGVTIIELTTSALPWKYPDDPVPNTIYNEKDSKKRADLLYARCQGISRELATVLAGVFQPEIQRSDSSKLSDELQRVSNFRSSKRTREATMMVARDSSTLSEGSVCVRVGSDNGTITQMMV